MKYISILLVTILDKIIWYIDFGPNIHKIFLSPNVGNFRVVLGRVRLVRLYINATKRVPAYKKFIISHGTVHGPKISIRGVDFRDIPEMDKSTYIKKYSLVDKLFDANLPVSGVMFDESSGSSGKPTSWVRGWKERRFTQRIMQVAYKHYFDKKHPIILNTFSMGAWATGLNTTICLLGVSRVKSIGPDIVKVIDTLQELGSGFEYIIAGYPPFLKQIAESKDINWSQYNISAIYGGEGISEKMREILLGSYSRVMGSYGASDLEINIAHETQFTIDLRKALTEDASLRKIILNQDRGVIPNIFQYNPYDYVIETNNKGELLFTICRLENISPRIRYNIHDLGHADSFYQIKKKLKKAGRSDLLENAELDFGLLFHYGRSDLSVDYNGAVVGPEEIKQIINSSVYQNKINNFRLISYEDQKSQKHLLLAVELKKEKHMSVSESKMMLDYIVENLMNINLDFKSAHRTSPNKPEIKLYNFQEDIFNLEHHKLKNDYVWNIDYNRAKQEGIIN